MRDVIESEEGALRTASAPLWRWLRVRRSSLRKRVDESVSEVSHSWLSGSDAIDHLTERLNRKFRTSP